MSHIRRAAPRVHPASATVALALACAWALGTSTSAAAHSAVRGPLLAPVYGGSLQIGTLISSEGTRYPEAAGESFARDVYVAVGAAYGVGPNTALGLYVPYLHRSELEQGLVVGKEVALAPWSAVAQQRLWRRDGEGSRLEAVALGSIGFFSPGTPQWPTLRPASYTVAGALTHTGLRDIASATWAYNGVGHEAGVDPTWLGDLAALFRPSRRWLASGHDLFLGMEATYEGAVDGSYQRLILAPVLEVEPAGGLWLEASYGGPVWERSVPFEIKGMSSLWLRAYIQR